MDAREAIRRIKDHFRIHDDGRPTPYLNEAVKIAIESLEKQIQKNLILNVMVIGMVKLCTTPGLVLIAAYIMKLATKNMIIVLIVDRQLSGKIINKEHILLGEK